MERPAVMDSGDIIVGTIQGSVYRLNSTGGQVWKVLISLLSLPLHPLSSRELSGFDESVIKKVHRFIIRFTEHALSSKVYCGSIVGSPIVAHDETIYFGSGDCSVSNF